MASTYGQIYDGDWIKLYMRGQKIGCCDCHLIHTINFRKGKDGGLEAQFFRDTKATYGKRRRAGIRVVRD